MNYSWYSTVLFVIWGTLGYTQATDSLLITEADSVLVEASRLPTPLQRVPYAISQLDQGELQDARQQWSLSDPLRQLPGLLILNDNNYAQDIRLSVRGFGSRAAFGIRGLRITVDGLPESTPDGQGQVDNIDPGILQRAELLRGPSSSLYGNAAGGVLQLKTESPPDSLTTEIRLSAGSFGFQRYQLKAGGKAGKFGWLAYGSHTRSDGFRQHSRMESSLFNGKFQYQLPDGGKLSVLLNLVYSPVAQDPGGLSKELAAEDPAAAWERNLSFDAQESVTQGRIGLKWDKQLGGGQSLRATAFYLRRDFENRLPFQGGGAVSLDRNFYGGNFQYTGRFTLLGRPYRLASGINLERQEDIRRRFDNISGALGDLAFDQLEVFTALGGYTVHEWSLAERLWLNASARYDFNQLEVRDYFTADGENSGERVYHTISPSFGLSYAWLTNHILYANYSYNFETPALSELSAGAGGAGGFNTSLQPQQAYNTELGAKGQLAENLQYGLALFYIRLRGELLPFEQAGQAGRVLFRNAGRSRRLGMEMDGEWTFAEDWTWVVRYNFSRFTYTEYELQGEVYDGNRLPGIPAHNLFSTLAYRYQKGGQLSLEARHLSRIWADDANTAAATAFWAFNFRGSKRWEWGRFQLQAFGGINNLLDAEYFQNVRINAFGGRYFEPAPGRHVYFGLQLRL